MLNQSSGGGVGGGVDSSSRTDSVSPEERMDALMDRVNALESRLNTEAVEKSRMAEEVEALREENVRLQEESAHSSQQLKRFTEWFFQTIDKNGT